MNFPVAKTEINTMTAVLARKTARSSGRRSPDAHRVNFSGPAPPSYHTCICMRTFYASSGCFTKWKALVPSLTSDTLRMIFSEQPSDFVDHERRTH